ncbi:ABC transporter permease [Faunimonas sp. B44]|uniref:ABC transporter permease n=1 Tax=Faunimonas sp. B44 TaxID=3461493 RepID=UPI004043967A
MARLVLFRAGMALIAMLLAAGFVFLLIHFSPTDPVVLALGDGAAPAAVEAKRRELGLDLPMPVQFVNWLGGILQGDFGTSFFTHRPVADSIVERLPVSLSLLAVGTFFVITLGLGLGFMAGLRPNSWVDNLVTSAVSLALATPSFWLALMLGVVFAVHWRILPVAGYVPLTQDPAAWLKCMLLPAFSLALHGIAVVGRHMRGAVIDVMNAPFIEAARARGTPRSRIVRRYVLKNALLPVLPMIGVQVALLVATSAVMEKVFILPGLGTLMVDSVISSDFPMLQGAILVVAALLITINLLVDIGLGLLDPRVRPQ